MTKCNHITRVTEWGFTDSHDFIATGYDCVLCGKKSKKPFPHEDQVVSIDHTECELNPCFVARQKG